MKKSKLEVRPGILSIEPYVQGLSKAGAAKKIIKLSSNENPMGPSPKAKKAYRDAAKAISLYNDGGSLRLREAIAKTKKLEARQIVCGAGSDELIALLIAAYAGPGDEVLYSEHGFLMYPISTLKVGAKPVAAKEKNLRADPAALLKAVTKKTKIVFIANPNNPTGSYLTRNELADLRKKLPENILLVIDAAYAEYATPKDYSDGIELAKSTNNTVSLHTFSKIYGLAALRLGWSYSSPEIADILNRVRGPFNVSGPAQEAGIAAISDAEFTEKAKAHNAKYLKWLGDNLKKLGLKVYPSIGNFILVEFPKTKGKTAADADELLKSEGIIVRRMEGYKLPQCLRITIGLKEQNEAVVKVLRKLFR